ARAPDTCLDLDREGHRRGPCAGARPRSRRLSGEAVRVPRAHGAHSRAAAPWTCGSSLEAAAWRSVDRSRDAHGSAGWPAHGAHGQGVRAARVPPPPRRPRRLEGDAGARRLAGRRAGDAARQRDRRHGRATAAEDRRSVRAEAPPHDARRRVRPSGRPGMKAGGLSLRARLTLWHAAALAVVICVFSAGSFVLLRARAYPTLGEKSTLDLAQVEARYRGETGEPRGRRHAMVADAVAGGGGRPGGA